MVTFHCAKSKNSNLILLCEKFVKLSLSCDEIIKDKINLIKIIRLIEKNKHFQLNQIKPEFIQKIEQKTMIIND